MKTFLASTIALLFLGTSFQLGVSSERTDTPKATIPWFSTLSAGDTILIRYESDGCEHHDVIEFRFSGGSDLTVSAIDINYRRDETKTGKVIIEEQTPLGVLILTANEAAGLDSVLAFYRLGPQGWCTTRDRIYFSHLFNGEVVASEDFYDPSCRSGFPMEDPVITLTDLQYEFYKVYDLQSDSMETDRALEPSID